MIKKRVGLVVSLFILSLSVCAMSFAMDVPDGATLDPAMSQQAFVLAQQQFAMLQQQLTAMIPSLAPDQQAMVNQAIAIVGDKLERLEKIEVYFVDEAAPGEAFDNVSAFYQDKLSMIQEASNEQVQFAVTQVPPGMIPQPTMDSLMALINEGKVKAVTGSAGKSRVSVLTVYLNPQTMALIEGTTIVVATDK